LLSPEQVKADKKALRARMRARRADIIATGGAELARRLAGQDLSFLGIAPGSIVSGFSSMPEELDTGPLLHRLHAEGFRLCLPVMEGKGKALAFRAWAPGDEMAEAIWGIREPKPDKPKLAPDVFLVPFLAFDSHGRRLGYGGGFYDRTLKAARSSRSIVAVGLGLAEMKVDAVPHLDYDERLDWVLTPSGPVGCLD